MRERDKERGRERHLRKVTHTHTKKLYAKYDVYLNWGGLDSVLIC